MKIKLAMLGFCLVTGAVQAQIYFRAGIGYALPAAQENIGNNESEVVNGNSYYATVEPVKASYGAGINFSVGSGYKFTKVIGADLGITYLSGKTYKTQYDYNEVGFGSEKLDTESKSTGVFFTPAILITPDDKLPYVRMGVVMGMPKIKGTDSYFVNFDGDVQASSDWEQRKNMAFGFQGAIGMQWSLVGSVKLFTEVNFTTMTYYPGEKVSTSYVVNGQNRLDEIEQYFKKTIYKDKVEYGTSINFEEPSEEAQVSIPFSSLSFQVGIVYTLGGIQLE